VSLTIRPLENVGVEVLGFDLNEPLDAATRQELEDLWLEHAILLFRGQDITARKQIEFSALFGPLERHPLEVKISGEHPELFVLEMGTDAKRDAVETSYWNGEPVVGRMPWRRATGTASRWWVASTGTWTFTTRASRTAER
jgi:taurine dioxygenase